ncbi:MAG: YhdP family protein [Sideroxydans sp.]|nr:YhdP family protein [Sideroxydans sp.]
MRHLFRIAIRAAVAIVIAGGAMLLVLRYLVLPNIEYFHEDITGGATEIIGQPVQIAHIDADWNGLRPRLLLSDVKILDAQGKVALEFPALRNTIAWSSLLWGEVRFNSIELDHPELLVKRDVDGRIYVAGILSETKADTSASKSGMDWLLHQSHIAILGGKVVWKDDFRAAPAIDFEQVDLVVENRWRHHRFSFRASPPDDLASRVDLRGDFRGASFSQLDEWDGEMFGQIAHVDTLAWSSWITFPSEFKRAKGAARAWLGITKGKLDRIDVDVDLHDLNAQLANELPPLELDTLRGRIGWHKSPEGFEFSTEHLRLSLQDGFEIKPTDLYVSLSSGDGYRSASGEINANVLNLGDVGKLLPYFPMEAAFKQRIGALAPRGKIQRLKAQWQGDSARLARYQLQADFSDVGFQQLGEQPGLSGLSGTIEGSDSEGDLKIDSQNLQVQAPDFLSEPLTFEQLSTHVTWQKNVEGWSVKLNNTRARNADMDGSVSGSYQINDGPGVADLTVSLNRASVQHAARYIPKHAFNDATYHWLQTGLRGGLSDAFQMRVRGDLREFPFPDSKSGLFKLEASATDVAIEFAEGWPLIEHADANLLIQGNRLEVAASKAMTSGAKLQNVKVLLPDVSIKSLVMFVEGEAADATQRSLDYIRNSPVRTYLEGYTDGFNALGEGFLKLKLEIPLTGDASPKVLGSYRMDDNEVDLGEHVPLLKKANGLLSFTNSDLTATDIKAQILGGPAQISVRSEKGILLTKASGTLNADSLPNSYAYPLLKRLHGTANWTTDVSVKDKLADVLVTSDLHGLSSDLPQPFTKPASSRVKVRFEQKDISTKMDAIRFQYGDIISADLMRTPTSQGGWEIKRGSVVIGGGQHSPSKEGIRVAGDLPRFSLEGWSGWSDLPNREGVLPNIASIDVNVGTLFGYGNIVHQLNIRGSGRNGLVSTRLTSRELNGDLIWQPQEQGRLLVRLKNAMLGESVTEGGLVSEQTSGLSFTRELMWPEVDVSIEKLTWKGRQVGKLDMLLKSAEGGVFLERFRLFNADAVLTATGQWKSATQKTHVEAKFDITNAGKLLQRAGYPESLKDAPSTFDCNLTWSGSPDEYNPSNLNGQLHLKTGKGRFLKINPGAAKLLGVLSLQALPKRISLDFTDVFSPGFEFDSINGEATIEQGLLKTSNFKMAGAAAKVTLAGQVDLGRETQNLQVRIMPTIGDNVSLLSFAAGPAVGVGVLLANKLLSDPLDKLVSFEYNVSGSWEEPKVRQMSAANAALIADE